MDKNVEKLCLDEISHSVCDEDRKVIITEISNNWSISYKDSESVLTKWLNNYNGGKTVLKEYVIRGVDLNGNCVITVVPERKLDALETICPKYTSSLYSIELEGGNGRRLNITQPAKTKFISLPLESVERKCKVASITVSPAKLIKTELLSSKPATSKGINSLFATAANKKEIVSNGASTQVKVKTETVSPKEISPKKESPKKASPKRKDVKSTKSVGAKSISSFFSSKPAASQSLTATNEKPIKIEPVPVKTESIEDEPPQTSKKRLLPQSDDELIPGTPPAKNSPANKKIKKEPVKLKKNNKAANNRSRIMQICDSSSDDELPSTSKKLNEKIESEEDEAAAVIAIKKEKENKTPTKNDATEEMETEDRKDTNGSQRQKKRGKVKKTVTKTFQDEEGYINSIRVVEEVSCSDDDVQEVPVEKKPIAKENGANVKEKKKISPPAGKKQGSILSFFAKK